MPMSNFNKKIYGKKFIKKRTVFLRVVLTLGQKTRELLEFFKRQILY
jgi:hypothetical protein